MGADGFHGKRCMSQQGQGDGGLTLREVLIPRGWGWGWGWVSSWKEVGGGGGGGGGGRKGGGGGWGGGGGGGGGGGFPLGRKWPELISCLSASWLLERLEKVVAPS